MENIKKRPGKGTVSREQWREHIEAWRVSGATQAAYCREHGVASSAFRYWKCRLERESLSGFVEVSHSVGQRGGVIDILVDERVRVRVAEDVGPEQLRVVLRTILEL
jgi:transposase-like protein